MFEKIVIGGLFVAVAAAVIDTTTPAGKSVEQTAKMQACEQAKNYGLAELKARGLVVEGCF